MSQCGCRNARRDSSASLMPTRPASQRGDSTTIRDVNTQSTPTIPPPMLSARQKNTFPRPYCARPRRAISRKRKQNYQSNAMLLVRTTARAPKFHPKLMVVITLPRMAGGHTSATQTDPAQTMMLANMAPIARPPSNKRPVWLVACDPMLCQHQYRRQPHQDGGFA